MLTGYLGNESLDIVLETDNTISLYHEKDDEIILAVPHKTPKEVDQEIAKLVATQ